MILIALGANLPSKFGSPRDTLREAVKAMAEAGLKPVAVSRLWLTAPVPVSDQPWYHNAVAAIETTLGPLDLLAALQKIENDFGRVREIRNEPRVLDLDLLAYDDQLLELPELTLPHPRLHERAFVLLPLRDIAPDWQHPARYERLSDLIDAIPDDQKVEPADYV
jgi:2-amino-4-hydroxy-6-hydroxymethyldihydropteridine diphosphokinase